MDFSGAFSGTQTRPIVGEDEQATVKPVVLSNKPSDDKKNKGADNDAPDNKNIKKDKSSKVLSKSLNKTVKSKKKVEDLKEIKSYISPALYKILIKKTSEKTVKENRYYSMSSLIKDLIEKGLEKWRSQ